MMTALEKRVLCGLVLLVAAQGATKFELDPHKITDTMAAAYTPMAPGGLQLNLDIIPKYASYLAKINITNVMPAGSNGESLSLTVEERMRLAEAWAKAGPAAGLRVYMHIGSESLVDSRALATHAASLPGISGVVCMTPVYFKPTLETLHDFLAQVAAAAPKLPFWFYHFPDDTGVLRGQAHALLELVDTNQAIPNFAGIKYTDYDLMDFQLCTLVAGGKYNMLFGRDEQALEGMQAGAAAAVSSTIQYSATLREVVTAYRRGDLQAAKAAQLKNARLCSMFGAYESVAKNVQKKIMGMVGMSVGSSRLPKRDLTAAEAEDLKAKLLKEGLIESPLFEV